MISPDNLHAMRVQVSARTAYSTDCLPGCKADGFQNITEIASKAAATSIGEQVLKLSGSGIMSVAATIEISCPGASCETCGANCTIMSVRKDVPSN